MKRNVNGPHSRSGGSGKAENFLPLPLDSGIGGCGGGGSSGGGGEGD
jgi:hypothetical protein